VRRRGLAVALFLIAPLVAEFLLGNLSITALPALLVLAPLYGGGALLVRESARRAHGGWPALLLLGLAYGVVEEGLATQSLFNPDYLRLQMHLLDPAHVAVLGVGAWWTVFVLTLHVVWSVGVSIALVEALARDQPRRRGSAGSDSGSRAHCSWWAPLRPHSSHCGTIPSSRRHRNWRVPSWWRPFWSSRRSLGHGGERAARPGRFRARGSSADSASRPDPSSS
jgi:hypothetical protein